MLPRIVLKKDEDRRLRRGHLWVFSNEVEAVPQIEPGDLVHLYDQRGHFLGTGYANPHSLILARLLTGKPKEQLGRDWWQERLGEALSRRRRLFAHDHYRWVHGEGDSLPGLIVDRFGDTVAIQAHTAGIERHLDTIVSAIKALIAPAAVILQNDFAARDYEHLPRYARYAHGEGDGTVHAEENGLAFRCNALSGQKTGYFFDQRPNRAFVAQQAAGRSVLDLFSYVGSFSVQALAAGANRVVSVDASEEAVAQTAHNVRAIGGEARWQGHCKDVMAELGALFDAGERFDIVICDPPAFVKSRKQIKNGLTGYQKLNRMAARLVAPGGLLCAASCSGLVDEENFIRHVAMGIREAGRRGRIVQQGGAGADHPWLPAMPESRYLKFVTLQLD